jgi:hypothetical protein
MIERTIVLLHICMTEAYLDPLLPENVGFRVD